MNEMIDVMSNNVESYRYEAATQRLRVLFRSGGLYEYSNVNQSLASAFSRPHPWRRVGKTVMNHPTRRIH
jgi:hypothetical protein